MPGKTGLEVARAIAGRSHVVFVTAYDEYAIAAFEEGAIDYLLKPRDGRAHREGRRAAESALSSRRSTSRRLLPRLADREATPHLKWIRASLGTAMAAQAPCRIEGPRAVAR